MATATATRPEIRSDEELQREVIAGLKWEPRVEREEAERAAWSAPGITSVENLIAVSYV